jgi:nucleotide-binding universal stress UspA family protein
MLFAKPMRLLSMRAILVASDLTPTSDAAIRTALNLSRACGASLHVIHVAGGDDHVTTSGRRAEYLTELGDSLRRAGAVDHEGELNIASGDPPSAIAAAADQIKTDVVILGRRSAAASRVGRPLGGTAYAVVTRAHAPCLAITEPLRLPIRKVLVAIDRSETARGTLLVALSWVTAIRPRDENADRPTLTVLQVEPGVGDPRGAAPVAKKTIDHEVDTLSRNAEGWAGVKVLGETVDGTDPATSIASHARQSRSDLVVLGTRGFDDPEAGLGSISATVTKELSLPVLLVPPAVWRDHAREIDYF